jgi:hypothetical protein
MTNWMRTRWASLGAVVSLASGLPMGGVTYAQETRLSIPWSGTSPTTVGTALDIDLVDWNRNACLARSPGDLKWLDGDGAVKTDVTIELVKDFRSLAKTLNLEVDYKSKASVSLGELKAGKSLDLNTKFESFAKDEGRTLALVVKAFSDYGRRGLESYRLDQAYMSLIDSGKLAEFRQQCGTHTVVAQRNVAMAAVVILLSDISSSAKQALEQTYASNFDANAPVKAATVTAGSSLKVSWKSLIETAQRTGKMKVELVSYLSDT